MLDVASGLEVEGGTHEHYRLEMSNQLKHAAAALPAITVGSRGMRFDH